MNLINTSNAEIELRRPALQPSPPAVSGGSQPFPLSFAQQRLWFIDQLQPGSALYNQPDIWRIKGRINYAAFQEAVNDVVRRQASLRTTFDIANGQAVQRIEPFMRIPVPRLDLRPAAQPESVARVLIEQEVRAPFNLNRGPLFRPRLFQLRNDEHIAVFTAHHIVWDGWSIDVFRRDLAAFYNGRCEGKAPSMPALPIQYTDFARRQRTGSQGALWEEQLAYWRRQLEGPLPVLGLPADFPRPTEPPIRGATEFCQLDAALTGSLRAIGRKHGATLFMTLLAAFKVLLHRYTREEDVLVGSPIAGRDCEETENLIGFFVNTLVLRTPLSGNPTFLELLARVRDVTLAAYANQEIPFERVVRELQPERALNRNPMFEALFGFEGRAGANRALEGLQVSVEEIDLGMAKFDWTFLLRESEEGIRGAFEYCAELFRAETIRNVLRNYQLLLEGIVADPTRRILELPLAEPGVAFLCAERERRTVSGAADRMKAAGPAMPPRTWVERKLAGIWSEVLGCGPIHTADNFFHLGGHSLLASLLVSRIGTAFQIELPVRAVFEAPTLQAMAERIAKEPRAKAAGAEGITRRMVRAEAEQLLARLNDLSDAEVEVLLRAPELNPVVP